MRKAFLAASALTMALSAAAWAQTTPPAATTGLHKPAPSGLVEQNARSAAPGVDTAAGATTPGAATTGGTTIDRATAGASTPSGVNNAAGETTPSAGSTGSSMPTRTQTTGLPTPAAGLPQNQYVLQMGERMRQWFPIVDTYLDAGIPPERANLQANVKQAWDRVRAEWDQLQTADSTRWNAARSEFETAYSNFERVWDDAQRNT